jgi:hypothetical protein
LIYDSIYDSRLFGFDFIFVINYFVSYVVQTDGKVGW